VLGFEEIPNLIGAGIGTTPRYYGTRASPAMRPTARSSPSAASAIRSGHGRLRRGIHLEVMLER
jgi:hypothetical protein